MSNNQQKRLRSKSFLIFCIENEQALATLCGKVARNIRRGSTVAPGRIFAVCSAPKQKENTMKTIISGIIIFACVALTGCGGGGGDSPTGGAVPVKSMFPQLRPCEATGPDAPPCPASGAVAVAR